MSLTSDMTVIDGSVLAALGDDVDFNGTSVRCIFMTGPREVAGGENVAEVELHECWCRKSDLPSLDEGDPVIFTHPVTAEVFNYEFKAQDPPDETGFCRIVLRGS